MLGRKLGRDAIETAQFGVVAGRSLSESLHHIGEVGLAGLKVDSESGFQNAQRDRQGTEDKTCVDDPGMKPNEIAKASMHLVFPG
jgi:hypothetical protein